MGLQSEIYLSFSVVGVSLLLPLWICLWTFHNSRSYCLTWGKKNRERKAKNKPPADFKPTEQVLLVFLDATGRGGLSFAFLPSYGFESMGTRSELQFSQLPSLQPRSSMTCQAQISHSDSGCAAQDKLRCMVLLRHSVSWCTQLKSPSGRASHCSRVPYKAAACRS